MFASMSVTLFIVAASGALDEAMARLEAEEGEVRRHRDVEGVPAGVAVRYLRELSTT